MIGAPVLGALFAIGHYATRLDHVRKNSRTHLRFAILNAQGHHYECMGHVLEYARGKRIPFDVFMRGGDAEGGTGWAALYSRLGLLREVHSVESFKGVASNYTHIFLVNHEDVPLVETEAQAPSGAQWHIHLRPYAQSAVGNGLPLRGNWLSGNGE